jgi:hypothetical protein
VGIADLLGRLEPGLDRGVGAAIVPNARPAGTPFALLALRDPLLGLPRGCESNMCTWRRGMATVSGRRAGLDVYVVVRECGGGGRGTPTRREVGCGESVSSACMCDSMSGIDITGRLIRHETKMKMIRKSKNE